MYTANWVDYYYSFFMSKKDLSISEMNDLLPVNLLPEYASYIKKEVIERESPIAYSWEKESLDINNSPEKTYTFNMELR